MWNVMDTDARELQIYQQNAIGNFDSPQHFLLPSRILTQRN